MTDADADEDEVVDAVVRLVPDIEVGGDAILRLLLVVVLAVVLPLVFPFPW